MAETIDSNICNENSGSFSELSRDVIEQHYQNPSVKEIILEGSSLDDSYRAIISGHSGWYRYAGDNKKLVKANKEGYENRLKDISTSVRQDGRTKRQMFWTTNLFNSDAFEWVEKDEDIKPGGYEETTFYSLFMDIDLKDQEKVDDLGRDRNVIYSEDRKKLEEAGNFVVDWLVGRGLSREFIKVYFSGNGLYVMLDPSLVYNEVNDPARLDIIARAFNKVVKQIEEEFWEEHDGEDYVQFDALNNRKRQFKTVLSVHSNNPFVCIPLDNQDIEINLEKAKPPLSDEVLEEASEWVQFLKSRDPELVEKNSHKLANLLDSEIIEVKEEKREPKEVATETVKEDFEDSNIEDIEVDIELDANEKIPPCINRLLNVENNKGFLEHARGKALLALFLSKIELSQEKAKKIWSKKCQKAGGATTNIFESWHGSGLNLPRCKKIRETGSGYPYLGFSDVGLCQREIRDDLCSNAHNLKEYLKDSVNKNRIKIKDPDFDPEFTKELEEKAFSINKLDWSCDTEFVTFTDSLELENYELEFSDTFELPLSMAEKLIDEKRAAKGIWRCKGCGDYYYREKEPINCPGCDGNNFRAYHPVNPIEIGDTLLDNYRYVTPRESMDGNNVGLIHTYVGGIYSSDSAKGVIREKVKDIKHSAKSSDRKHVMNHIADNTGIYEDQFGIGDNRVVLKDGILDLDSLEMSEHDPETYALNKIDIEYDPDAECPTFERYLDDVMNEEDQKIIQEFLGTILVNSKPHKKSLILVGPTDSGKSTFIEIIKSIIGKDNCSSQSPIKLSNSRWSSAKLRGRLLNATDEVSSKKLKNLATLKRILDGNDIEAERKREKTFEFSPTCEHIFAANQTPTADRKDDAFWNRWIVIEMPNSIAEDDQDPDLPRKILEERKGIFNWIVDGYKRFEENDRKFTMNINWEESRDRWLNWGNSIQRFIQQCVQREKSNKISSSKLHEKYSDFVKEHNLDVESQKKLTSEIKKINYANYSDNYRFDGKQKSGFRGIAIKRSSGSEGKDGSYSDLSSEGDDDPNSGSSDFHIDNFDQSTPRPKNTKKQNDSDEDLSQREKINIIRNMIGNGIEQKELLEKVKQKEVYNEPIKNKLLKDIHSLLDDGDIMEIKSGTYKVT